VADFNQALQLEPELVEAFANRGLVHSRRGDYVRAIADYDQAIGLTAARSPDGAFQVDEARLFRYRGLAFLRRQDFVKAVDDFNQALQLHPGPGRF
jgi:tetratricopeptide (TPR) repeat protein